MYNLYVNDIYRFLLVHVRDAQLAEDLTADTFTQAWNRLDTFDFKQTRGWLYTIARNRMYDYWRKQKTVPLSDEIEVVDEEAPEHGEVVDRKLQAKRIIKALKTLPEDMKSVVTLRFLEGYSVRATAEALHLSESNVRVVQYRALKKLKKVLS